MKDSIALLKYHYWVSYLKRMPLGCILVFWKIFVIYWTSENFKEFSKLKIIIRKLSRSYFMGYSLAFYSPRTFCRYMVLMARIYSIQTGRYESRDPKLDRPIRLSCRDFSRYYRVNTLIIHLVFVDIVSFVV